MKRIIPYLTLLMITSSCTTYHIPVDSLRDQFADLDSSDLKHVVMQGAFGEHYKYLANPIYEIACVDKSGNPAVLINSPSIEMRVTETSGKKTIFYFDRVFVTDSTLTGVRSRFISSIRKTIKLNTIKKIEVQDGKKKLTYLAVE